MIPLDKKISSTWASSRTTSSSLTANSSKRRSSTLGSDCQSPFTPWTLTVEEVSRVLTTDTNSGISESEALSRSSKYGPNSIDEGKGVAFWEIFLRQACNAMVLVLLISMAISFAIKDYIAGGVIAAVFFINVIVGFIQEFKAEKTMQSLKSLSSPTAHAIREGLDDTVPSMALVPGDIIIVKVGDTIPADSRIISSMNLETDEALLTGESLPVTKSSNLICSKNSPVGDRQNMLFSSSVVTKGRGTAIVTSTGMDTEIGMIAKSLRNENSKIRKVKRDDTGKAKRREYVKAFLGSIKDIIEAFLGTNHGTPLHRLLAKLSIFLFGIAVVLAIIAMAAQKFIVTREVAVYAIVLAIAMIPASLVVVLTITMAMGTKTMAQRNVIVRKLDSLESLGAVNDICSDKTGTLTQGKMILKKVWVPGLGYYDVVNGVPSNPDSGIVSFSQSEESSDKMDPPESDLFSEWITTASLVNIANVRKETSLGSTVWKSNGDPTEIAVQVFTTKLGYNRNVLVDSDNPRYTFINEYPFDSSIKRMSSVYNDNETDSVHVFTKGAVERILGICTQWYGDNGEQSTFSKEQHEKVLAQVDRFARQGLRVLAFARRQPPGSIVKERSWKQVERIEVEQDMIFLGLAGIYDPPREETAEAVRRCHTAGINVHMLTGDHPTTATAIAKEVGILPSNLDEYSPTIVKSMVFTAPEFDALSDNEIDQLPLLPLVIARCAPQTKVRMIEALHRRKAFAAMSGDGVNDSPSLKKADVGIAMGLVGSDVAKDASDIILSDDNFASILAAVEEGRRMAENIQKFTLHLLAGNISQALFLVVGLAFKDNDRFSVFPLSPVEVLWIIMITSSFPAMGLGIQKAEVGIMNKKPKNPKAAIFTWEVIVDMLVYGLLLAVICMVSFIGIVYGVGNGELGHGCNERYEDVCQYVFRGRSTAFIQMTWCLLILAWEVIDSRKSLLLMNPDIFRDVNKNPGFLRSVMLMFQELFAILWENQMLFWSVVIGFFSVIPIIYIPVINKKVFQHSPIGWEWGVGLAGLIVFIAGSELYKWCKRIYYRNENSQKEDVESHHLPFMRYNTLQLE
ncbi:putative Na(+)-exporting P-type ATPase ENA5 [Sugiyamaella lignohabitans]|uniref:P-type Na(+) transporter n=1 Tax=Sugiyamaella lignohabitans TaxID=796027 RepID=A0A167FR63_9ASCO|nr:putative Na(+)-exporting P-type ATPase ENA5 [Sugiyamaella lignohabitans]ANB15595.1 putative Na(+)-exporting P-type ATPase ENA5 [Sugiyamaella lignohabitans]